MGRWSRQISRDFIAWLQIRRNTYWLEIGCGTGALTAAICSHAAPDSVVACDPSEMFVRYARAHLSDDRVSFIVADADSFPFRAGYDSITSSFALNFFPDIPLAVRRMSSVASPNGIVSACVWDYAEGMQFLRYFWDCATLISSAAALHDEAVRFPMCRPEPLVALFRDANLVDVRCEPLHLLTTFASFEDYWQPFLGGTGPAPSFVSSLGKDARTQLRTELERVLPVNDDGTITLSARAWVVRGTRQAAVARKEP